MTDKEKLDAIRAEIHRLIDVRGYDRKMANDLFAFINSLPNEPISENLEEAAFDYAETCKYDGGEKLLCVEHFKAGAKWQKEHLWKLADGGDLPEYEREVVVFTQNFPDDAGIIKVAIAHRPDPKGWNGKSITTGEIEHYIPKTYDKGGWNIPDVVLWLDLNIPNLEED